MSLIPCADCGQQVSDASAACIHCGRPMSTAPLTVPAPAAVPGLYPYFPVATHKFVILSLCTLNFYPLYWCYQNWWRIGRRSGEELSPFWRSFFAPIWAFGLFQRIREDARTRGVVVGWSAVLLAALYFTVCFMGALPDEWWLVSQVTFIPFLPVVHTIHQVNDTVSATESRNENYSGGNVAAIVLGGLFLLLAVVGTFLPKETEEVVPDTTEWSTWQSSAPCVYHRVPSTGARHAFDPVRSDPHRCSRHDTPFGSG
jgi:hypothetical protein